MRRIASVILAFLLGLTLHAQTRDFGIWQYYTVAKSLGKGWGVMLRLEHRSKNNAQDLDCALVMPGVTYQPASWLKLGFIYDYAMTKTADRQVLLPYAQVSRKFGNWSLSARELGQYIVLPDYYFLLRSKLQVLYLIPDSAFRPIVALETYTTSEFDLARMTNLVGVQYKPGKHTTFELGYNLYYLKTNTIFRHTLSFGVTCSL